MVLDGTLMSDHIQKATVLHKQPIVEHEIFWPKSMHSANN